jgi:hypothetical protein
LVKKKRKWKCSENPACDFCFFLVFFFPSPLLLFLSFLLSFFLPVFLLLSFLLIKDEKRIGIQRILCAKVSLFLFFFFFFLHIFIFSFSHFSFSHFSLLPIIHLRPGLQGRGAFGDDGGPSRFGRQRKKQKKKKIYHWNFLFLSVYQIHRKFRKIDEDDEDEFNVEETGGYLLEIKHEKWRNGGRKTFFLKSFFFFFLFSFFLFFFVLS